MELETTQTSTTANLPMLKQVTQKTTAEGGAITTTISSPVTAKEKIKKKNDVKAISTLLMALPNEHLMTFNKYKDAKSLFAAIETRFGDFGRFLPSEWNTHVVVWRNKSDLDTMSIDDLYNNFKIVEQEGVSTASTQSSTTSTQASTASSQTRPKNQDSRNRYQDRSRRTVHVEETPPKAMVTIDGVSFDSSYMAEDEVPTNMALMAFSDSEFESYGPKSCEIESKNAGEDILNEHKEHPDAPLVKDRVSKKKDCSVKSLVVVEKKIVVLTIAKVEVVRPKQQEKPVRKIVRYAEMYKSQGGDQGACKPLGYFLDNVIEALQVTNTVCRLFLVGASFTQGMISSIPIGGSISHEGFLLPILLLVVIVVMAVIIAVILVVVVVVIVGVFIVITIIGNCALLYDLLTIGLC
nr:hypothetical protein [Tanacetum cinerariifolium]